MANFKIIGTLVAALMFGALLPTIASSMTALSADGNVSGAAQVMIGLVVLFVTIGFIYYIGREYKVIGK